jgi:signal transduction histidine kinase
MIIIVVVSAGISVAWALSFARRLSAPLLSAAQATQQIAAGRIVQLSTDSETEEVHVLMDNFNRMSHKLQVAEATQRDFLQNASHELRTPLMSIQGYAEGLSQGVFTHTKEIADQIAKESKRLTTLVEELLMLSRIESPQYAPQLTLRNLNDVMPELIDRANGIAVSNSKRVIYASTGDLLMANVDESLVFHAVTNILANALRYAATTVTVTLSIQGASISLVIQDDGNGIDPADLPYLFQRFHKGKGGQFGLGLTIAKSAMNAMNGEIVVSNEHGARFELRWPRVLT